MLKRHSQLFEGFFAATDLLVVSIAWLVSYWVRFSLGVIPIEKGVPEFSDYVRMLIFVWLIWAFVFRRFALYRPMRGTSRFREAWLLVRANAFSVILLLAATYLFREKSVPFSRAVFVIFWLFATLFTIASRSSIRVLLRYLRRRGYNLRYALIVGSGALAQKVMRSMLGHPEFGTELIGCLTSDSQYANLQGAVMHSKAPGRSLAPKPAWASEAASDVRIVGTYADLPRFLESGKIDQVIIAMPLADHDLLEGVINSIGDAIVDVRIVPDVHQFIQLGSSIEEFDGLPVVSLASTPLTGFNVFAKRSLDILLGTIFLVLFSPLMLLIALLVKLTSRGPIFFEQERVGLDGRTFNIYKFRTMRVDAERSGARFAVKDDPRATPIGKFLRRFSLDELPQLFNVLKGQMSLVGPRPERPVFISEFRRHVPRYMLRHKVQAGMTGWAQVNGWRGNTSIERRIEHDLYYIEHWSLGLDLKILGLTLVNGFRDRNAY
ncbi:MAG: undecaprenyl-phosphate glucose phosphotransferase [Bdellovibrionota bacterium]